MIDSRHLKRLLLGAAVLLLVAAAGTLAAGVPVTFAGGLALGYLLGAAPFASWSWIVSRAVGSRRGKLLAVVLLIVKLAFYAGALYLGISRALVSPLGVMIGMTAVAFALVLGSLWTAASPAKEVS
jgi:hypothetical protein